MNKSYAEFEKEQFLEFDRIEKELEEEDNNLNFYNCSDINLDTVIENLDKLTLDDLIEKEKKLQKELFE